MRLNDIQNNLDTKVDIKSDIGEKKLGIDNLRESNVLIDINSGNSTVDITGKKYASISNDNILKSNNSFDSILEPKKVKDLDLRYIDVIKNILKPKKKKKKKKKEDEVFEKSVDILNIEEEIKDNNSPIKEEKIERIPNLYKEEKKRIKKEEKKKKKELKKEGKKKKKEEKRKKTRGLIKSFFTFSGIRNLFLKIGFVIFLFFAILLLDKIIIVSYINSGYEKLVSLKENPTDIVKTTKILNDAKLDFVIGDTLFKPFLLLDNQSVRNGYHIISGGKEITKLGDNLVNIFSLTKKFISYKGIENTYITNLLNNLRKDFIMTEYGLEKALSHYNKISFLDDDFLEKKLEENKNKLSILKDYIYLINSNFDTILNILGHNREKKYLVVFQNSDEIRPTGGFMGSLGIITLFRGKVKSFEKKDVYEFEWDLKKVDYDRLKAPKGIIELTDRFGLRDSNYFVNLKDSSENIRFFIEKSGNKVDGIIYLNQNILLEFLEETGGIEVEGIKETITSKNFSELMSILVEAKLFKKGTLGTPKKILFDFMEVFFKKLKDEKDYSKYGKILLDNLNKREILFYSFLGEENQIFELLGLGGKINYLDSLDFTYPVYTSLSGNKSDRYRQIRYEKDIIINNDCSIDTTFTISSTHFYPKTKEDEIESLFDEYNIKKTSSLLDIQGRGDNYQFVRVLLPKDAIIDNSEKYNIQTLSDKKSLEFFMRTKRLETSSETISYKIMNNVCRKYDFILYKQAGIRTYDMSIVKNGELFENFGIKEDLYYNIEKK